MLTEEYLISCLKTNGKLNLRAQNIKDDEVKFIAEFVKRIPINELDLSYNSLSCTGLRYLADVLKYTKTTRLLLQNNNINDEGLIYLTEILKDTKVKILDLSNNQVGCCGALYLNRILSSTEIEFLELDIYYVQGSNSRSRSLRQISCGKDKKFRHYVTIADCHLEMEGFYYFSQSFQETGIYSLSLTSNLCEHGIQSFAKAFKNMIINNLVVHATCEWKNGDSLTQAFKGCNIMALQMMGCNIPEVGIKHLAKFLQEVNVLVLDISLCKIGDAGTSILAPAIANSNLMAINFAGNSIGPEGVQHLSRILHKSKITHLRLNCNNVKKNGIQYLAKGLQNSQVIYISVDRPRDKVASYKPLVDVIESTNLSLVEFSKIESNGERKFDFKIDRTTISMANKIQYYFKNLMSLDPMDKEFKFVMPKSSADLEGYLILMETFRDDPNSKVHVFNAMCSFDEFGYTYDYNLIKKINHFLLDIVRKFNAFFNEKVSDLMDLVEDDVNYYVNFLKRFEEAKFFGVVENLLLHRQLYYVDDERENLHPLVYKLLSKYKMPLYNKINFESDGKEEIVEEQMDMSKVEEKAASSGKKNKIDKHQSTPKHRSSRGDIKRKIKERRERKRLAKEKRLSDDKSEKPEPKEIPKGAEDCLADLSFAITGELDTLSQKVVECLIKQYGGRVWPRVSKNLNYIIVGRKPGPKKLAKAKIYDTIEIIDEDGFLNLLKISSDEASKT